MKRRRRKRLILPQPTPKRRPLRRRVLCRPAAEASVETLINEFRAATAKPEPTAEPEQPEQPADDTDQSIQEIVAPPDLRAIELEQAQRERDQAQQTLDFQRAAQQENADLSDVATRIAEQVGEEKVKQLPPDYIAYAMLAEYQTNAELREIWNNRYNDQQSLRKADAAVKQTISKIAGAIKQLPNPDATEDYMAVVAAVKGASTQAPAGREPDVARMSDQEFRRYQQKYGYSTL